MPSTLNNHVLMDFSVGCWFPNLYIKSLHHQLNNCSPDLYIKKWLFHHFHPSTTNPVGFQVPGELSSLRCRAYCHGSVLGFHSEGFLRDKDGCPSVPMVFMVFSRDAWGLFHP